MENIIKKYADQIGISGSVLCLIHCTVLPLLGILSVGASSNAHTHFFAGDDILFALVAIIAAYFAAKNSQKALLKISFWFFSLLFAFFLIISEISHSFHWTIYLAHFCALGLIITHGYHFIESRKEMRCKIL